MYLLTHSPRWVAIRTSSHDQVEADGWGEAINKQVVRWLQNPYEVKLTKPRPLAQARTQPRAEERLPALEAPAKQGSEPEAGLQVNEEPSWLARTWRDHAATLLITILGTVLATLIGYWLFRIFWNR